MLTKPHKKIKNRVTVVGAGYVGLSLAVLLAQRNDVIILDIDLDRVKKVNSKKSTVVDSEIESFLDKKNLSLTATGDQRNAFQDADFIIVATPTNYDTVSNSFDTSSVDAVVENALKLNSDLRKL